MPTRSTYTVLVALLGVALLFGGLSAGYQASGTQHIVANASATVDYDTPSELEAPSYAFNYSRSITVTRDNQTLTAGADYEWNASTGTVTWLNSTATSDGDSVLVDYGYTAPSEATRERRNILGFVVDILAYAVLAVGVYAAIELTDSRW